MFVIKMLGRCCFEGPKDGGGHRNGLKLRQQTMNFEGKSKEEVDVSKLCLQRRNHGGGQEIRTGVSWLTHACNTTFYRCRNPTGTRYWPSFLCGSDNKVFNKNI